MPMILALNGVDPSFFGEFGAASSAVAGLQTALKNFGKNIGDKTLLALVVDGLIGPKTVAAANRALRTHIGAGQAPAELRTGVLTKAEVVTNAERIKQLVNTEARRRGFGIYVGPDAVPKKVVAKKVVKKAAPTTALVPYTPPPAAVAPRSAAVAAQSPAGRTTYTPAGPVYTPPEELGPVYTPPATRATVPTPSSILVPSTRTYVVPPGASGGGMDVESIVKWSAIGLGVVALLGGAYYLMNRQQAMAGLGATESRTKLLAQIESAEQDLQDCQRRHSNTAPGSLAARNLEARCRKLRIGLDWLRSEIRGSQRWRDGGGVFSLAGAGGFYHTSPSEFSPGQRVQLHPGLDLWMRGARYGTVKKIGRDRVHVEIDATGKTVTLPASRLQIEE